MGEFLACKGDYVVFVGNNALDLYTCCREDVLNRRGGRGLRDEVLRELVGAVVMTRYNNKTYRIDDINWNMSPLSSFELASGEKITFQEYYL